MVEIGAEADVCEWLVKRGKFVAHPRETAKCKMLHAGGAGRFKAARCLADAAAASRPLPSPLCAAVERALGLGCNDESALTQG